MSRLHSTITESLQMSTKYRQLKMQLALSKQYSCSAMEASTIRQLQLTVVSNIYALLCSDQMHMCY
jgi:hypothetical protein